MFSYRFCLLTRSTRFRSAPRRSAAVLGHSILWTFLWLILSPQQAPAADLKRIAPLLSVESTADFGAMRKRGVIRVLVTYKRTDYFVVNGQQRGFEYELMEQFERSINKGGKKGQLHLDVVYIPMPFDSLITNLVKGRGDIAAAGLTITPDRSRTTRNR